MQRKIAELLNVIFGFRKFLLMLMLFAVGIGFRTHNLIDGAEFVQLLTSTTIAFFGANGIEHIVNCVNNYNNGKNATDNIADDEEIAPVTPGAQ